ncbi:MAG TPA: hypothetical protein VHM93_08425, partial [Candidatus Acidoferrum sp.]|nr:hypothetical protein [Candidatus Acidoferrum sp.]
GLRPFLRQLDWEQWQSILKRLQAISDHVHTAPTTLRPIGNPARLPQSAPASGHVAGHIATGHANGAAHAHMPPQGYAPRRDEPFAPDAKPFGTASRPAFLRPLAR